MYELTLRFEDNQIGLSTKELLYDTIARQYPHLAVTQDKYPISSIQHFSTPYYPERTIAILSERKNPDNKLFFTYARFKVSRYIDNPLFDASELESVQSMDEITLLAYLAQKKNLNFNPDDFVVMPAGIVYTGGVMRPNWRLQAKPDSPFWYDDQIIELHSEMAIEPH